MTMPELARVTATLRRHDAKRGVIVAERDRLIRAALAEGQTLRAVGATADLTYSGVADIRDRGIEQANGAKQ